MKINCIYVQSRESQNVSIYHVGESFFASGRVITAIERDIMAGTYKIHTPGNKTILVEFNAFDVIRIEWVED